jgi:hydroxymethyl cephem carbamoyltransferase
MLFDLADPSYPDSLWMPLGDDAGKLMALAAYGDPADADEHVVDLVDRLLKSQVEAPKGAFRDSPLYNAGVESEPVKIAAALLTQRMFDGFVRVAQAELPADIPLYIAGGCGLNCDWNMMWRELGYFSSVFVPPCPNDSGSAVGTACDALLAETGDPRVEWDVYCGLDFEMDTEPSSERWQRRPLQDEALSDALLEGRVVAWVQGRWEMGPRALGNRSLLAEPSRPETRDRLNHIKLREDYRPIAPCCRVEDLADVFDQDFEDPYMLYFRMVRGDDHGAITHVDGSARCQTVSREGNPRLHQLLTAFRERYGVGLLCNTSLNFKGYGFINRMSDLVAYCERRGVDDMVVGDVWYERVRARRARRGAARAGVG